MFLVMGFYLVDLVSGNYVFGVLQMLEFVLYLVDGKIFIIIVEGLLKEYKYIDSIILNGEFYVKNYIFYEDILKGGMLIYKMK